MVPNNGAEDDADELFRGVNQAPVGVNEQWSFFCMGDIFFLENTYSNPWEKRWLNFVGVKHCQCLQESTTPSASEVNAILLIPELLRHFLLHNIPFSTGVFALKTSQVVQFWFVSPSISCKLHSEQKNQDTTCWNHGVSDLLAELVQMQWPQMVMIGDLCYGLGKYVGLGNLNLYFCHWVCWVG